MQRAKYNWKEKEKKQLKGKKKEGKKGTANL